MLNHDEIMATVFVVFDGVIYALKGGAGVLQPVVARDCVGFEAFNLIQASLSLYKTCVHFEAAIDGVVELLETRGEDKYVSHLQDMVAASQSSRRLATDGIEAVVSSKREKDS